MIWIALIIVAFATAHVLLDEAQRRAHRRERLETIRRRLREKDRRQKA